jgi:hypothetical protein
MKENQNNRNFKSVENWKEADDGHVEVIRETDDGLGTKKTENLKVQKEDE